MTDGRTQDTSAVLHYYTHVKQSNRHQSTAIRFLAFVGVASILLVSCGSKPGIEVTQEMRDAALATIETRQLPDISDWELATTEGGVEYVKLATGNGPRVMHSQEVRVHYYLWLTDGTLVDFTRDVGVSRPYEFEVGSRWVIAGWSEVVREMNVGDKAIARVPARMAYGRFEREGIPPNSDLIFFIEVLRIL